MPKLTRRSRVLIGVALVAVVLLLTAIYVPSPELEALRDLVRTMVEALMAEQDVVLSF